MGKTAIVLGATGATGSELVKLLVKDTRYSTIKLFTRSSIRNSSPKIEEHLIDLFDLEGQKSIFTGDEVFCCVGTTKAKTPDRQTYYKIDHGIPAAAAQLAKENDINTFILISAISADKESSIFYNRVKGEMEEAVLLQNIRKTHILQPSLIVAKRPDTRFMEKVAGAFMKIITPLLRGKAAKYKSLRAIVIARAMVRLANKDHSEVFVPTDVIAELAAEA